MFSVRSRDVHYIREVQLQELQVITKIRTLGQHSQLADMEKQIFFAWTLIVLLSLLSAEQSSGSFFSSLQFTRDVLMDFSRGSQRIVDITLASKITTKTVNKTNIMTRSRPNRYSSKYKLVEVKGINKKTSHDTKKSDAFLTMSSESMKRYLDPSIPSMRKMRNNLPKKILVENHAMEPLVIMPSSETVIVNQTKREVYKPRTSPSNKFIKAINDIELAEANANALGVKYSYSTLTKLKSLVEKAIQSKSFIYARQVR